MNKRVLGIIICLLLAQFTPARANTTFEFRSAAFFPMSHRFRDVYDTVGVDYEFEMRATTICCLETWLNFTWYPRHSHHGHNCHSHLNTFNFSFGLLKSCCFCDCFYLYGGIGPVLGGAFVTNEMNCCSRCGKEKDKDSAFAIGGMVKGGILWYLTCNLFLDLFVDYFYEPAFFHHQVDIGGFRTGLGLGVAF